jgi:transglutaminase-like putative cysteine protease
MPIYNVHHLTIYRYARPVSLGEHRFLLRPRESEDQHLIESELVITPEPMQLLWSRDALGNLIGTARFAGRTDELRFESKVRVAHSPWHPDGFGVAEGARTRPVNLPADELPELLPYLERRFRDETVTEWARSFLRDTRPTPTLDCLTAMIQAIRHSFSYVRRVERGTQTPALTLASRSGTCRDFAVLMMDAVRAIGLPARFVSGYLYVPSRDRHDIRGGGATHAWLQVYLPGAGWVDFDPTNAIMGNAGLIRVAVTREPEAATPLSGSFIGFRFDDLGMYVTVKVTRADAAEEASEPGGASLCA